MIAKPLQFNRTHLTVNNLGKRLPLFVINSFFAFRLAFLLTNAFVVALTLSNQALAQENCSKLFLSQPEVSDKKTDAKGEPSLQPSTNYAHLWASRESKHKRLDYGLVAIEPKGQNPENNTNPFDLADKQIRKLRFENPRVPGFFFRLNQLKSKIGSDAYVQEILAQPGLHAELTNVFDSILSELNRLNAHIFDSAVDKTPLNNFLNHLDYLHNVNPDVIASQIFNMPFGPSTGGSLAARSAHLEVRRMLYNLWLSKIPTAEAFLQWVLPHTQPFSGKKLQQYLVGTGHFLENLKMSPAKVANSGGGGGYLNPTEHNPQVAIPILQQAPAGVYISVGTLRTNIGSSLTPNATHVIRVDSQQESVEFGRMDTDFLRLAKSKEDLSWLMKNATMEEIKTRVNEARDNKDSGFPKDSLITDSHYLLWFRQILRSQGYRLLFADPENTEADYAYKGANYIHSDELFYRLSKLAKAGKIANIQLDLSDLSAVDRLVQELKRLKLEISVFDMSDTWYSSEKIKFLPIQSSAALITDLKAAAHPDGIVLMTSWFSSDGENYDFIKKEGSKASSNRDKNSDLGESVYWRWNYFGFHFSSFRSEANTKLAIGELNRHFERFFEAPRKLQGTLNAQNANAQNPQKIGQNSQVSDSPSRDSKSEKGVLDYLLKLIYE